MAVPKASGLLQAASKRPGPVSSDDADVESIARTPAFDALRHGRRWRPPVMSRHVARSRLRGAPWRRVVVMGDSVAAGEGDPVVGYRDLSWADRLVEALPADDARPDEYRNLGQRGLRAEEIRDSQLDRALEVVPDLAVLSAGGNDALGRSFDADRVRVAIDEMVAALRAIGADVVLLSLFDLSKAPFVPDAVRAGLHQRLAALAAVVEEIAASRGCWYVDYFGHPLAGDPTIYSADHLHVNRRGHAVVATEMIRALTGSTPRKAGGRHLVEARG
jgi:lysophospholipase L1-like esterase